MTILTHARLEFIQKYPLLESSWHYVAASVLGAVNKPQQVPVLYRHVLETSPAREHVRKTAEMREAILKSTALIGLPRVINSLTELKNATAPELRATELARANKTDFRREGNELWDIVYGKIALRVHNQLHNAYPDLDWFATNFVYGPLLSDASVLSPKQTELTVVATLVPLDVNPQLKGHLKGAVNAGNTLDEVNAVRDLSVEISKWAGIEWSGPVSKL